MPVNETFCYYIVTAMVGKRKVLITKLGSIKGVEYLNSNHYIAHRLNLAVLSSIRDTIYLSKIDGIINQMNTFYEN